MDSREFLASLINKEVWVNIRFSESLKGTLIWDDGSSIGLKFTPNEGSYTKERIVLFYKSSLRSIESAEKGK